jgi:hypothetical protein
LNIGSCGRVLCFYRPTTGPSQGYCYFIPGNSTRRGSRTSPCSALYNRFLDGPKTAHQPLPPTAVAFAIPISRVDHELQEVAVWSGVGAGGGCLSAALPTTGPSITLAPALSSMTVSESGVPLVIRWSWSAARVRRSRSRSENRSRTLAGRRLPQLAVVSGAD